jgi:predicted adenylyl cyclase CyaB
MTKLHQNIELKARYADLDTARGLVEQLDAKFSQHQDQLDTYFHVPHGRLKLRQIAGQKEATLIWYQRPDETQFRTSTYYLVPIPDPEALKAVMAAACGIRGQVHKARDIYLYDNVRIHLDRVERLGTFVEFEAVLSSREDQAPSQQRLDLLHRELAIEPVNHCAQSYAELMGI